MLRKKTFTKKAPNIFWIQVQHVNISDIFYKIQNLMKRQMKAVVPFLPRNLKRHSPYPMNLCCFTLTNFAIKADQVTTILDHFHAL